MATESTSNSRETYQETSKTPMFLDIICLHREWEGMSNHTKCPLCGEEEDDPKAVYSHLMTHHRKSTLSQKLLESKEAPRQ